MKRIKRIISWVCVITLIISSLVVANAADESSNTDVKVIGIHKSSTKDNIYIALDSLPGTDTPGSTTYSGFTVDVITETTTQEISSVSVTSDGTIESCIVLSIGGYLTEEVDYELILKGSAIDDVNNVSITLAENLKIHIDSTGKVYEVMSTDLWPGTYHSANTQNIVSMQCEDLTSYLPGYVTLDSFINSDSEQLGGTYDSTYDTTAEPYYMNGDKGASLDNMLVSFKIKYSYTNSNVPIFLLGGSKNNTGFGIFPSTSGNTLNIVNYDQKNYPLVDKGEATEQPYSLARVNVTKDYDNNSKTDERSREYAKYNIEQLGTNAFFQKDKDFLLQLSFEYYDSNSNDDNTKDKLKLGVYVEGKLMKLEFDNYTTTAEHASIDEDGKLVMSVYRNENGTHYHGANADFLNMTDGNITLSSVATTPNLSDWSLQPIGAEDGVFQQLSDGTEEVYSSFEFDLSNSRDWMQLCYSDNEETAFYDGTIFHIKGMFEVVERDNKDLCYHDTYNKAIYLDEKYQWKNEQWSPYEDVTVKGVYKDSKNGLINLRLSSLPNAPEGFSPVSATYDGLTVEISDGTSAQTYSVSATADTTKNLTINLSSYMNDANDYEITLKAGLAVGYSENADFSMNIVEDFTFYQDKSTGLIYEAIGRTRLIPGENFNLANVSGNYLTGADYTDGLPDFVYDDERWTIYLKPLNEESGVFRKSLNGGETRLELITDYKLIWPTETKSMYRLWISEACQKEGDIFTIKGKFQVMNYNAVAAYKSYHKVLDLDKVQYQYEDAKWKWVSDDSIYLAYQEGNVSFESVDSETSETKIYALEADEKSGIFVNDIRKPDAYLTETDTGTLCVHLPATVTSGDKITLTGGFLHPTDGTVVTYAETNFWYGENIVQTETTETINTWYDDSLGKSKTEADINADGELDVLDIIRMKRWYGEERVPVKNTEWTDSHLGAITHQSSEKDMMSALCDRILEMGDYMDVMPIAAGQGPFYRTGTLADEEAKWGTETNYITDDYYQLIANVGINTIKSADMDYNTTDFVRDGVKKNLELSAKYGLGYYVKDSKITAYADSTDEIDTSELAVRLAEYSYYPAYRGVNIVDEPNSPTYNNNDDDETQNKYISKYQNLMNALNAIRADSLSGILPWYTSMNQTKDSYVDYVAEYCDTFKPKLLGYNHYPFTQDTAQGKSEPELNVYFWNMSVIREQAEASGIPFGGVVQAGGYWNDNKVLLSKIDAFPTEGQFRWNVNTYLAFGAKSISYFPLIQPWHFAYAKVVDKSGNVTETRDFRRNGLIGADGQKNQWYDWAQEMNQQITVIDEVLMNSVNQGLIASGTQAESDLSLVNSKYLIANGAYEELKSVEGNALVGCFDFHGKTALYVVNYDMDTKDSVTITLEFNGEQKIKQVQKAKTSYAAQESLALSMEAGEGILLVLQ